MESIELSANGHALICGGVITGLTEAERHLRDHLTDGVWHDSCGYCQRRRVHGGTGVPDGESSFVNDLIEEHEHVAHMEPTC